MDVAELLLLAITAADNSSSELQTHFAEAAEESHDAVIYLMAYKKMR